MPTPSILLIPDRYKAAVLYSQIPDSGAVDFDVTRATTAYRTNASGILESVASGVPRLDYPIGGGCPSLLIEPAATNILLNSQLTGGETPTSWTNVLNTGARTPQASVLVTGQTAFRFVTSSERTIIAQSITVTSGTVYTFSFYIEQLTTTTAARQIFNFHSGATSQVWRDPDGLILDSANNLPNKLGKYTITATANDTTIVLRFGAGVQSNTNADLVVVAPQLETGSVATSYIPTVAATATRNADVISKTGVSGFIGQTEGVWYYEGIINDTGSEFQILNSTRNVTNSISITRWTTNRVRARIWSNSVLSVSMASANNVFVNTKSKIALSYESGSVKLFYNGALVASSTDSFAFTVPISELEISVMVNFFGNSLNTNNVDQVLIFPTKLTDAQCIELTTL